MTSGQFQSFPVDKIYVERDERQRRELNDIEGLAVSIKQVGLINPLTIERDGKLRAGERRLNAVKQLGWTHTTVQFVDDLNEHELQLLELEENIRRQELPWQDECLAIKRYHELRSQEDGWTIEKTADAINASRQATGERIAVAAELVSGNERVVSAPIYSTARGIVTRTKERRDATILAKLDAPVTTEGEIAPVKKEAPLLNADFHEWQQTYEGPKFNLIHCDFPYGISADKHHQGAAKSMGGYADSLDIYGELIRTLNKAMENVVAESAHLMFWFSMDYYEFTRHLLGAMGWDVSPFPLIWHKSDNIGILPDPSRGPRRIYETCFHASRGDRKIVRAVSNLCSAPTTSEIHMSEKSPIMLRKFMEMFVDEYTMALDPTCGSANALKAAKSLGAHTVLGLELDPEFYTLAKEKFYDDE